MSRSIPRTRTDLTARELMIAELCHDLRSYLHVINGYVEILCGDRTDVPLDRVYGGLSAASHDALKLVHAYLELTQMHSPDQRPPGTIH